MSTTNMRANQQAIGDFNELLAQGSKRLEEVYRSLLLDNSRPLEPLHYLTRGKPDPILFYPHDLDANPQKNCPSQPCR